jgi:hypothetical protein
MRNLKDLMIEELVGYGWLDREFKKLNANPASYVDWLKSLRDEDFLAKYNDMREIIATLD